MDTLFEYPLTEKTRGYLRLEFLFDQLRQLGGENSYHAHHAALGALFELLEMLDHGDTRAELHSDLEKQLQVFKQLLKHPNVDAEKLSRFLQQLERLHTWIIGHRGKFGALLRENEFLQNARQRFSLPGGACAFDLPRVHCFLQRPAAERSENIMHWSNELQGVRTSVEVLLRLMREQAQWRSAQWDEGYFHLEPVSGQLLRLRLQDSDAFAEVSSGPRRCVLRLCRADHAGPIKYLTDCNAFEYALGG